MIITIWSKFGTLELDAEPSVGVAEGVLVAVGGTGDGVEVGVAEGIGEGVTVGVGVGAAICEQAVNKTKTITKGTERFI
jgi:hypothetical protein